MIIQLLAGCSAETVAEEYHLSEQGLGSCWKAEAVVRLLRHPALEGSDSHGVLRMLGAREEVMRAVVRMVDRLWGGVEGFLSEMVGVDQDVIGRARENLREVDGSWLLVSRPSTP